MNNELQTVLEYLERERGVGREMLIVALESALMSAARKSVTPAKDVRVEIDRKTLNIHAFARLKVVDRVFQPNDEIILAKAQAIKADVRVGDTVDQEITPKNFGRIAAQTAKQTIMQRIRQAEKERVFEEYKNRPGDIVSGLVQRFERNDVIVDLGRAEAVMPARERVPTEEYQPGERLRAFVLKVESSKQGTEIILSRSHPDFVKRLFQLEVSEIADGTVEIKGIAREAGYRTKLAVVSHEDKVDPVGACVGMKGIRVKNIVRELGGEKIDIVRWNEDIRQYVTNALAPAKLLKVTVDEPLRQVKVLVDAEQLSLAIGKKGQNARLTAKLTGWKIDIQKEEAPMGFAEQVAKAVATLAQIAGIGEEWAEKLVHAGFLSVEQILSADVADLNQVDGANEEVAQKLHEAAEKQYEKLHGKLDS